MIDYEYKNIANITEAGRGGGLRVGGGGVATGGGGGHVKFHPYEKGGGAEKVLAQEELTQV